MRRAVPGVVRAAERPREEGSGGEGWAARVIACVREGARRGGGVGGGAVLAAMAGAADAFAAGLLKRVEAEGGAGGHAHGHAHDHAGDHAHDHSHGHGKGDAVTTVVAPDGRVLHSHDGLKPHYHEPIPSPGDFHARARPLARTYERRAFTVGIGGPVGTGKTALMLALCRALRDKYSLAAVTNDIFTREDGEFLQRHEALPCDRIRAIETGGCPHAAIREDISMNLQALEELSKAHDADLLLIESGGDNLAANYSRELADFIVYIIDVSGGDKIPRKGGPGITQADLLVINKTDIAEAIGADLGVMARDAAKARGGGATEFCQVRWCHARVSCPHSEPCASPRSASACAGRSCVHGCAVH